MPLKWTALGVLPNIDITSDVFGGEYLALVGSPDSRYKDALTNGPNLQAFLSKFEGSHGQRLRPSLLIKSDAYPDRPNSEAISSFMDIVVACVVLDARVRGVTWRRNVGPFHTDAFEIGGFNQSPHPSVPAAFAAAITAHRGLDGLMKQNTAKGYLTKVYPKMTAEMIHQRDPDGEIEGWLRRIGVFLQ